MSKISTTFFPILMMLSLFGAAKVQAVESNGATGQISIEWRLADSSRYTLFRDVYSNVSDTGVEASRRVSDLFTLMSSDDFPGLDNLSEGEAGKEPYKKILETLSGDEARLLRASNYRNNHDDVTENDVAKEEDDRTYSPSLLKAKDYYVVARLAGTDIGHCDWEIRSGTSITYQSLSCGSEVTLIIPADFMGEAAGDTPREYGGHADITVRRFGTIIASSTIEVKDKLVVAIGDSFIAGEGNPDIPSKFQDAFSYGSAFRTAGKSREDAALASRLATIVSRPGWAGQLAELAGKKEYRELITTRLITPAVWWDGPCHRSMLSWPVLSTFYYAAKHPQEAVTLLHLGCSGATISEGILGAQSNLPGSPRPEIMSQMDQLSRQLNDAGNRKVDVVLMSVGGNDAGFASLITYGVVPPNGYFFPKWLTPLTDVAIVRLVDLTMRKVGNGAVKPFKHSTRPLARFGEWQPTFEDQLGTLSGSYRDIYNEFVRLRIVNLPLGIRAPELPANNVFQFAYPDILRTNDGEFCYTVTGSRNIENENYRGGFESLTGILPIFLKSGRSWAFELKNTPGLDCEIYYREIGFSNRGGGDAEVCQIYWAWRNLNETVSENLRLWQIVDEHVERSREHGWCVNPVDSLKFPLWDAETSTWDPVRPSAFDPYRRDLGRWFRTANDSALSQWAPNDGDQQFFHNGTIHPTFNEHLIIAGQAYRSALAPAN